MKTIRRILVAIKDTAGRPCPAIEKAAQIAHAYRAQLHLFHAVAEPVYADFELTDTSLRDLEQRRIDTHLGRLQTIASTLVESGLRTSCEVRCDHPPYEAIVRAAKQIKADLIVAECHAGRRLAPWLLHLTDWELIRTSAVPVLLARTPEPYANPILLAAIDPAHVHAKPANLDATILVAAQGVSRHLGGALHVMHAYVPLPLDAGAAELLTDIRTDELYRRVETRARASFDKAAAKARVPRALRHLVSENPVVAIPRVAREIGADIVIMGAVSRSALKRVFIGNTAERVLGAMTCDVLIVKPKRFKSHVARRSRGVRLVPPALPSGF